MLIVENDEIISEDSKNAKSMYSFFSNIVKNLKIPECKRYNDSLFKNVSDPILKVVLKYRKYPSILTTGQGKNKSKKQLLFTISQTTRDVILNEILSLDTKHVKILIYQQRYVKLVSAIFLSKFYFSPNDSPSKTMENVFHFIEKAHFVLEIFKFLYIRLPLFFSLSAIALEVDSRKILKFMTSSIV